MTLVVSSGLNQSSSVAVLAFLRRRWPVIVSVAGLCGLGTVGLVVRQPKLYKAEEGILVRAAAQASGLSNPVLSTAEAMRSPALRNNTLNRLQQQASPHVEQPIDVSVLDDLKIVPVPGTDIIRIQHIHASPEFAVDVVRTLTDLYIEADRDAHQARTTQAREQVQASILSVQQELSAAEQELQKFQQTNPVASLGEGSKEFLKLLVRIEEKLIDNLSKLAIATEQASGLRGQLGVSAKQALDSAELSQTKGVQKALAELESLESELDKARTTYQDEHPAIQALNREIEAIELLLSQRIEQIVQSAAKGGVSRSEIQVGDLRQGLTADLLRAELDQDALAQQQQQLQMMLTTYQEKLDVLPQLEQIHRVLAQRLATSRETYQTLQSQLKEIETIEGQPIENVTRISAATLPLQPLPSNDKLIVGSGLLMGALLSFVLALIIDRLDQSIKSPKEAQKILGYPILATIPPANYVLPRATSSVFSSPDRNQVIEVEAAYRDLQANLHYTLGEDSRTVVVTHVESGETKAETATHLAANLAAMIASGGQSVLFVDLDPASNVIESEILAGERTWLHSQLSGLVQVLKKQASLGEVLQHPAPNLSILPLGASTSSRPIIALDQFSHFLRQVKQSYQFVIISAPAINQSAETLALSRIADGMLLTINPKASSRDDLAVCSSVLHQSRANVLGMVLSSASGSQPVGALMPPHKQLVPAGVSQDDSYSQQVSSPSFPDPLHPEEDACYVDSPFQLVEDFESKA